jgi:hypothetical protein
VAISSCSWSWLDLSLGLASQRSLQLPYYWFGSCLLDRVAGNGDVWRVGLRQPVNDDAVLRQRIQNDVKCGYRFRGLREAGTV